MSYRVSITNNATGETKLVGVDLDWLDHTLFWWTDGNFGCDCNRSDVFHEYAEGSPEVKCGGSRFTVHYALMQDGSRIDIDDADPEEADLVDLLRCLA